MKSMRPGKFDSKAYILSPSPFTPEGVRAAAAATLHAAARDSPRDRLIFHALICDNKNCRGLGDPLRVFLMVYSVTDTHI
jgi:hypothetical protein